MELSNAPFISVIVFIQTSFFFLLICKLDATLHVERSYQAVFGMFSALLGSREKHIILQLLEVTDGRC